jgi:hypothetical protein
MPVRSASSDPTPGGQLPPDWRPPDLELRILAAPRPGPRDLRWYLGGILAVFVLSMFAGPYLREHPVSTYGLPPVLREDIPAALRPCYDRALAGEAGAMRELGTQFCAGRGVPRDLEAGVSWLRLAAAAGDLEAARDLERLGLHPEM